MLELMFNSRRQFLATSLSVMGVLRTAKPATKSHFAKFDSVARRLVADMSLDEKIGQMTQPEEIYLKSIDDVEKYHLGCLLSGGDANSKSGPELVAWTDLYDRYQSRALKTKRRIPLLYGIDARD